MTEQEIKSWIERNIESFSNEQEARDYIVNRLAQEKAKEDRVIKFFINRDEYFAYSESHKMGKDFDYDEEKHDAGEEYEDFIAVCAYEYK